MRLIRSKGVGVFFVTQLPDDVPDDVLAQLGNRVQHALRAFTPRDAKALKAAVTTYPKTDDYDLEEDLTQLGIGEAMVTILSERGAPTPVVWTRHAAADVAHGRDCHRRGRRGREGEPLWPEYAAGDRPRVGAREARRQARGVGRRCSCRHQRAPQAGGGKKAGRQEGAAEEEGRARPTTTTRSPTS